MQETIEERGMKPTAIGQLGRRTTLRRRSQKNCCPPPADIRRRFTGCCFGDRTSKRTIADSRWDQAVLADRPLGTVGSRRPVTAAASDVAAAFPLVSTARLLLHQRLTDQPNSVRSTRLATGQRHGHYLRNHRLLDRIQDRTRAKEGSLSLNWIYGCSSIRPYHHHPLPHACVPIVGPSCFSFQQYTALRLGLRQWNADGSHELVCRPVARIHDGVPPATGHSSLSLPILSNDCHCSI